MRGAYARERAHSFLGLNEGSLREGERVRSVLGLNEGSLRQGKRARPVLDLQF